MTCWPINALAAMALLLSVDCYLFIKLRRMEREDRP